MGLAVFAVGLATTIPMPLYTAYAARSGGGAGGLALAFAAYAGTVIVTAPLLGALSDRIGRKPCMMLGVAFSGLSILLLIVSPGLLALTVARAMQGLGTGIIAGAGTAWAAELGAGTRRAAAITTTATAGGFAMGGLATLLSLIADPQGEPPLTYWALAGFAIALLPAVALLPETRRGPPGPWLRLPGFPRGTLPTTLGMVPGWGTTGVMLTAIPAAMAEQGSQLVGPFAVCVMILVGVVAQQALKRVAPRRAVLAGLLVLALGDAVAVWGTLTGSLWPLLVGGGAIGCAAYGLLFLGGLAAAVETVAPAERARASAGFFLVAHIGFAAPPLLTGLAIDALGAGLALPGHVLAVALAGLALAPFIARARQVG